MANTTRIFCIECKGQMFRVRAQTSTENIPIGFYCPTCKILVDIDGLPLIPYRIPFHIEADPTIGCIRDIYPKNWRAAIIKLLENPNVQSLPENMMRKLFLKDTEKDPEKTFETQVRHNEIKEAAGNQEKI